MDLQVEHWQWRQWLVAMFLWQWLVGQWLL